MTVPTEANLEIERKLVLSRSARSYINSAQLEAVSIEQVYLPKVGAVRCRIRQEATSSGVVDYNILCAKRRVAPWVAEETEIPIDTGEFRLLRKAADPCRVPVRKTRWRLAPQAITVAGAEVVEAVIDHLLAPARLWMLEVELPDRDGLDAAVALPDWAASAVELARDPGWTCAAIALRGAPRLTA